METNTQNPTYQTQLSTLRENLKGMLPAEALNTFDSDAGQLQKEHTDILKLKAGDHAEDFTLPNASGKEVTLSDLLEKGKVVLTFYRGTWCPYCNLQLAQYQQILPELIAAGASLVAISPQSPDESLNIKEKNELKFEVLSDKGNAVAGKFTTIFRNGDAPVQTMTDLGFDFDAHYEDDSRELPVPAVFVIDSDRKVIFARSEGGDYRNRVEPADILKALK